MNEGKSLEDEIERLEYHKMKELDKLQLNGKQRVDFLVAYRRTLDQIYKEQATDNYEEAFKEAYEKTIEMPYHRQLYFNFEQGDDDNGFYS